MQLGFTHRPFQAQQQPIVVGRRVVDPLGIADQRLTDRADVEQMAPIPVAPRNARHVETENQADLSQRRPGNHLVEAGALAAAGRGLAQILGEDGDPLGRPAQRDGALDELTLATLALRVLANLVERRLPHADAGPARAGPG